MTDININNYEDFLLSYIDGELSAAEQTMLMQFLQQYPQYREELELLQATRLAPDETVRYGERTNLYRYTAAVRPLYRKVWWAAAFLVLLSGAWWLNRTYNEHTDPGTGLTKTATPALHRTYPAAANRADNDKGSAALPVPRPLYNNRQMIPPPLTADHQFPPDKSKNDPSSDIAVNDAFPDTVTFPVLSPLKKEIRIQEPVVAGISATVMKEARKQMEAKMQDMEIAMTGKKAAGDQHAVVITISGHSSNPLMGLVGGVTHILAKADRAYQKIDQYKITSIQVGK